MDAPHLLWKPDKKFTSESNLTRFIHWLFKTKGLTFKSYQKLWEWSTTDIGVFWLAVWEYFEIISDNRFEVPVTGSMPYTKWFDGASLNYAQHIFRKATTAHPAIIFKSENSGISQISWEELEKKVASLRSYLQLHGIRKGDRVTGWLPNIPEAVISFLAVNSLGAVWSGTSPDFGTSSVLDRFAQIEPKLLIAADGYSYNGKWYDKTNEIRELQKNLPTLETTILIPLSDKPDPAIKSKNTHLWDEALTKPGELTFEAVPFSHPIWVLYSSGTTGLPKAITHSHGGVLLEHLKYLTFHNDVKPGERFFWYSTTGWMMWNYLVASLLSGATIVLYDGSPGYPDLNVLWHLADQTVINHFGTSAPFIIANMKAGTTPGKSYDLSQLRSVGSTGAPLPPDGFNWMYENVKKDLWLTSMSGGSDVCSAFVGGNPLWPVYSGEIQCRALGCKLEAYNEKGMSVTDEVGEMVITEPMPSMPVYFWNDPDFSRYKESYFEMFPGNWRHGDWIMITKRDGVIIYGRSDTTLNRGGVRIGTTEIYRVLDKMPEIEDSIIICVDKEKGEFYMPLFVVPGKHKTLDNALKTAIKNKIRNECSPRHVPDDIIQITEVPYTISGKKTEAPVKKILMGQDISGSLNKDALKNPKVLDFFIEFAGRLKKGSR